MQLGRPEPCRPLTRRPGAWAPIPGTLWKAQLFPTQIRLEGPLGQRVVRDLPIEGAVQEWTAQLDLDRFAIRMWGKAKQPFSILLQAQAGCILWRKEGRDHHFEVLASNVEMHEPTKERIQFGEHALQDVDRLNSHSLSHAVPTWFRLGYPLQANGLTPDEPSLAGQWAASVARSDRQGVAQAIHQLRKAGFHDLWNPQSQDTGFWGFGLPPTLQPAFQLLASGARLLRDMVVQHQAQDMSLLPCLPKELPAGRWLYGEWTGVGVVHFEWTRGFPRRMLLVPTHQTAAVLRWQGTQARLSPLLDGNPQKQAALQIKSGQPFEVLPGQSVLLDRFCS
jgi:hypothetical protein